MRPSNLLHACLLFCCTAGLCAAEPAVFGTLEDSDLAFVMQDAGTGLPAPTQSVPLGLPSGFRAHGVAFVLANEALIGDFNTPRLVRVRVSTPSVVAEIALPGRESANGSFAVAPGGDVAISVGESAAGVGEFVVIRGLRTSTPTVTPIAPALRVRRFATQAIDFAADGRAFICHTTGTAVMDPPYTQITFDVPATATNNATGCRLSRDGQRLFITRSGPGLGVATAPFTAQSVATNVLAPAGTGGLVALAVAPDGNAVLVGQAFRPGTTGPRARLFIARAPYTAQSTLIEIPLPSSIAGDVCSGTGGTLCPGFEDMDVNATGTLAIATGNSSRVDAGLSGRAPALFIRNPFDDATRELLAVTIGNTGAGTNGRGTGAVRFAPFGARLFGDNFEGAPAPEIEP